MYAVRRELIPKRIERGGGDRAHGNEMCIGDRVPHGRPRRGGLQERSGATGYGGVERVARDHERHRFNQDTHAGRLTVAQRADR